ncbi:MAG: flagellar motor protein MotB [Planctomycetota bacterium]
MPKKKKEEGNDIPDWVVTYGDLMSLLLCFFILIAAFSELKQEREFRKAMESIKEALGFRGGLGMVNSQDNPMNSSINSLSEARQMSHNKKGEAESQNRSAVGREQEVKKLHEGVKAAVGAPVEFDPAQTELSDQAKAELVRIAEQIRGRRYIVEVRGHAFGFADQTGGQDLLDMSMIRARTVLDFLVRECGVDPRILRVVGAANHERVSANAQSLQNAAKNRRVEVVRTELTIEEADPDPDGVGRSR